VVLRRLLPLLTAVAVPLAVVFGIWLGGHPDRLPTFLRDGLVDDTHGRVYEEVVDRIAADYYKPVSPDRLLNTSIDAAVASLKDPFSHYFDPSDYRKFQEITTGEFEGVGMTVREHPRGLRIVSVFKGGPAAKARVKPGDLITDVNGKSLKGKSSDESTALIKGPAGTSVRLTVVSGGKQRTVSVERASVDVPVVTSRMERRASAKVAYVALESFTAGAHGEVRRAVNGLLAKGAEGVVLDLRDNGGGLLNEAVLVSSLFIPEGTIVTTRGRSRPARTFEASGRSIPGKVPVVVLVNGNSASASEIVTGALQDRGRAKVVGTRTFGKGVFQEVEELSNGGALDITVGEYFTPKGRNLGPRNGKPGGIAPDVEAKDVPSTPKDEALQLAMRTLLPTA
jgi:carboxyl-terminal processing protease